MLAANVIPSRVLRSLGTLTFVLGFVPVWVGGESTGRECSVDLRITSPLPFAQIPVDPWIDFASLATEAGVKGVLDPNSIQVLDAVSDSPLPHALSRHFHHGQHGRVQWVVADPERRNYRIRFRMGAVRPPLDPRPNVPMIGTGDLLRYNAGEAKPISLPILGALVDLTGDGKRDLVGTVIYTYSPDRPPGGIVCYPRVGDTDEFRFGDPVAIRYLEASGASEPRHLRAGYLHLDAGDLNGDGLVDLVYASPADGSHQNPRSAGGWIVFLLNTGRRDDGGLPIFQDHGRISRPRDWWGPVRIVDLDRDGVLDLVVGSMFRGNRIPPDGRGYFIRNTNPGGWPFQPAPPARIDPGVRPSFHDLDGDGLPDSICLVHDPESERKKYFKRVAWRRNLGGTVPRFGPPRLLEQIDVRAAFFTASVPSGPRRGVLVAYDHFRKLAFFEQVRSGTEKEPAFRRQEALSLSAHAILGEQSTPYPCDWDGDGDWDLLAGDGFGFVRVLINEGSGTRPVFLREQPVRSQGEPIRLFMSQVFPGLEEYGHNMGYTHPVYVDWDGDQLPDLMLPNLTNRIYWYRNVGTRSRPRFGPRLQVLCEGYPDGKELLAATAKLLGAGTGQWKKRVPNRHQPFRWRARAAFADLDGNGLTDLVTAAAVTREAHLFRRFQDGEGSLLLRDDGPFRLPDGDTIQGVDFQPTQFFLVDWNGDGLLDLFFNECRRKSGEWDHNPTRPLIYPNVGTRTEPRFGRPQVLALFGKPLEGLGSHGPYYGFRDLDGDGKPDILASPEMGTYFFYRHTALELDARPNVRLGRAVVLDR